MNTHIFEIEQLACVMTGLDYDEIDANTELIEEKLMEVFDVDLNQLQKIVESLLPLINSGESPLTKKIYKGFCDIKNQVWLTKMEVI